MNSKKTEALSHDSCIMIRALVTALERTCTEYRPTPIDAADHAYLEVSSTQHNCWPGLKMDHRPILPTEFVFFDIIQRIMDSLNLCDTADRLLATRNLWAAARIDETSVFLQAIWYANRARAHRSCGFNSLHDQRSSDRLNTKSSFMLCERPGCWCFYLADISRSRYLIW